MKDITAGWPKRTANHFLKSFEDAATRPDEFLNRVIRPSLYGADAYVPVAIDKATKGRHAGFAELLADGQAPWANVSLFSNQLAHGDERPLDRVIFGARVVFTFESDTVPLADQVEWTRSRKRPEKSPLDQLFASLSRFADFCGITANWSGNKSVHIHIVFGTDHAKARGIGAQHAREGIVAHWERLCADITPLFGFGSSDRFDPAIRFPESYRRRPNGIRPDNGNRQVTLWERFRSIASAEATVLFWQADAFKPAEPIRVVRQSRAAGAVAPIIEAPAIKARLDVIFTDWPRCHSVVSDGQGGWRALFSNGPADRNPSSFMGMRSRGVAINGGGFIGDEDALPRLPLPLADMIDVWSADSEVVEVERSPLERAFADRVTDSASAAVAMADVFRSTISKHPRSIVKGPEGVGKSTVLFQLHTELAKGKPALYAFTSYGEAEAKCAAFNAANAGTGYAGVVLPSFSRAYKAACEQLDLPVYTSADAARMGYASHLAAIVGRQPAVMAALASLYTGLWETIGDRVPVFFTVHDVAHGWARGGLTRAMASQRYWSLPQAERMRAASDIDLGLMVHDECRADTFVRQVPKAVLDFIETLRAGHRGWDGGGGDLADLHAAWLAENGRRIEDDHGAGFDALLTLNRSSMLLWQHLTTVADPGCYPSGRSGKTVYRDETVGREWAFLPQDWWKGAAERMVMLTTEELPIAVARKADPTWHVVNLEAPKARRDTIDVTTMEDCTGRRLEGLIEGWRGDRAGEEWAVVSNRAAALDDTMSHLAARGSNAFVGRNVLQTMTFLTPAEYARLAALGEWCGEGGRLIWLRHVDELNQSAGRNLGFRGRERARHVLLAPPTLFALLVASGALETCRYAIALTSSRDGRRSGRKAVARCSEGLCVGEGEGQPPCG